MRSPHALTWLWLPLALALAANGVAFADDTPSKSDPVAAALAHSIIGPRQTLGETIDHAMARIPRMPALTTVAEWEAYAKRTRAEVYRRVLFRGAAAAWRDAKTRVEWLETIDGGPGYHIRKLRYEAVPGFWVPALLYQPDDLARRGKVPAVLNVNGHDPKGKAADYKQLRCINLAKRGILALNVEWLGMGQLRTDDNRHDLIAHLDLCGTSGVAVHYLMMTRAVDLLLSLEHTDPSRVAVTGLSGGGWQTITLGAFDTRLSLVNPVAGYSSFLTRFKEYADLGEAEQTPVDLGTVTDYAVMTALVAPRPLLLTYNAKDDCCFAADHALPPLIAAAAPVYRLHGKDGRLRSHVNNDPGTHNYLVDNRQAFYRMLATHFFANAPTFDPKEIPSEKEVKTAEQLHVALPPDNGSFHGLALGIMKTLPKNATLPADARRNALREVVRAGRFDAHVVSSTTEEQGKIRSTYWRLKIGDWSVPVVELTRVGADPKGTALLIADDGRASATPAAKALLNAGRRVLALDPYYIGEAKLADRADMFALLLATAGDRPLGVQATQIAAVARWASGERKTSLVAVVADGPRTSVMALVAAGLEPDAIASLELRGAPGSLKPMIEARTPFDASPELFCFGLLEHFDIPQLAALAAPRPVTFVKPTAPSTPAKAKTATGASKTRTRPPSQPVSYTR
jgi:dienelactone hydrolase